MALFYLVRHGDPVYDHMLENGFFGFGRDFAPLSEKGKEQAEIAAKDIHLKSAEFIVSSPYTRALQTAQINSRETGLRVEVDIVICTNGYPMRTTFTRPPRKALNLPMNLPNTTANTRRAGNSNGRPSVI